MSFYDYTHPYHQDEEFETIDLYGHLDYDWDMVAVFRNKKTNRLVADADSGCSCYGPFEWNLDAEKPLTPINSMDDLRQFLKDSGYMEDDSYRTPSTAARLEFEGKVRNALRRKGAKG